MDRATLRFRLSAVLTVVLAGITVLTAIVPDWVEEVFGVDPDGRSGAAEWTLVLVLAVLTVATAATTAVQWRGLRQLESPQ
jgi:hypothetical protein